MAQQSDRVRDPEAVLRSLHAERADHRETRGDLRRAEHRLAVEQARARKSVAAADRANSETAEVRERLAEVELALLRLDVALAAGLPPEAADRLRGSTREEFEADAADLLALRAQAAR
jgi:hypothetical protein